MSEKWYYRSGGDDDVALSTRVRFARNLEGYPFAERMTGDTAKEVRSICEKAIKKALPELSYKDMEEYSPNEAAALAEKHLISPQFAQYQFGRGLALSEDESVSIMVGEEDHLRIQVILPGFQLKTALSRALEVEKALERELKFSFDDRLGYLTHCPTNLGTGMRASVMLHLPALTLDGSMRNIITGAGKIGLAIRGLYGEGSDATGNLYQVSNQVTLGISEEETAENLQAIVSQLITQERTTRKRFYEADPVAWDDRIYRAKALLTGACRMTTTEFMKLISDVRLGVSLGLIDDIKLETVNALIIAAQPAGVISMYGTADESQRDEYRCRLLKQSFGNTGGVTNE